MRAIKRALDPGACSIPGSCWPDDEVAHAEHRRVAVEARERALDALEAALAAVVGEARELAVAQEDQQVAGAELELALPRRSRARA